MKEKTKAKPISIEIKNDKGEVQEEGEIFESETCEIVVADKCKESIKNRIRWKYQDFKYNIQSFLIKNSMKVIRKCSDSSNTINHAKQEFKALGYKSLEEDQEEDPNKWIQENVIDLLTIFSTQGHSGFSASFCINYFEKLASHKPLSPIQCTDDEWDSSLNMDGDSYQNKRLSSVFKKSKDGTPYYLDAIVWKDENGCTFTGEVQGWTSSQNIRIPFTPKTFYVDVISTEWADEDETVKKEGGGWWTSEIKDRKQLAEVFEYYDRRRRNK